MRRVLPALVTVALALAACGKKSSSNGDDKKKAAAPAPKIDLAAINALVPASLKDKVVFEERDVVEERGKSAITFHLAAPKGWKQDMKSFASIKPVDDALGFMTEVSLSSNCDGKCEEKDWKDVSENVDFKQFRTLEGAKIEKDVVTKTDHLMVVTTPDRRYVAYAWWQPDDDRYHACRVTLADAAQDAEPAFEKACQAVGVSGDD